MLTDDVIGLSTKFTSARNRKSAVLKRTTNVCDHPHAIGNVVIYLGVFGSSFRICFVVLVEGNGCHD